MPWMKTTGFARTVAPFGVGELPAVGQGHHAVDLGEHVARVTSCLRVGGRRPHPRRTFTILVTSSIGIGTTRREADRALAGEVRADVSDPRALTTSSLAGKRL